MEIARAVEWHIAFTLECNFIKKTVHMPRKIRQFNGYSR
jgi:hypothetical protein